MLVLAGKIGILLKIVRGDIIVVINLTKAIQSV